MVRKLLLTAAFALSSLIATEHRPTSRSLCRPAARATACAAAADYSEMKGTKVEIVQAPYDNVFEQAANAGQTKSGVFDIILMDDPWIPFFAENGHLEDLTSYFNAIGVPGPDNDFLAKSLAVCRNPYNTGPFVCIPYVGNAQMFFYDGAKFAEQGVTGGPKTWDDVIKAAKAMTDAGGGRYFGYVFRGGQGNPVVADFMPIFWSYGANLFNADRTKVTIDTPEGAAAMKTFMALRDVSPKGVESYQADEVGRALAAGTAASSINWPNWVATFEDPSQSQDGRQDLLFGDSGRHPCRLVGDRPLDHGHHVGRPRTSRKPSTSWSGRPRRSRSRFPPTRGNPPVRFSVFTDPELTSQEKFRHFPTLMEAINFSTPRPRHPEVAGDRERLRHRAVQGRRRHDHAGRGPEERAGGGREDHRHQIGPACPQAHGAGSSDPAP